MRHSWVLFGAAALSVAAIAYSAAVGPVAHVGAQLAPLPALSALPTLAPIPTLVPLEPLNPTASAGATGTPPPDQDQATPSSGSGQGGSPPDEGQATPPSGSDQGNSPPSDEGGQEAPSGSASASAVCTPIITLVTPIAPGPDQTIAITGSCFGSQAPYNGDSPFLEILDVTKDWHAGYADDAITLNVSSWTDGQIIVGGFTGGYGSGGSVLASGDAIAVYVWNAQTDAGPASFILSVSP